MHRRRIVLIPVTYSVLGKDLFNGQFEHEEWLQ